MDNKLIVELLLNDIAELEQLTHGLHEINTLPPALLELAKHKVNNIARRLDDLTPAAVESAAPAVAGHDATPVPEGNSEPDEEPDKTSIPDDDLNEVEEIENKEQPSENSEDSEGLENSDDTESDNAAEQTNSVNWISRVLNAAQKFRHENEAKPQDTPAEDNNEQPEKAEVDDSELPETMVVDDDELPKTTENDENEQTEAAVDNDNEQDNEPFDLFNTMQSNTLGTANNSTTRNDQINKGRIVDIFQGMTLGDRFYYQRTLFESKGELMNMTVHALNQTKSLDEAQNYLISNLHWNFESEDQQNFLGIVARLFA